ncbi:MAG TPA: hypothetical protein VK633_11815 [Verrucomicrobiae bacterium]|nr:hypothetical protein [Verrucomicrobiae bacterium]
MSKPDTGAAVDVENEDPAIEEKEPPKPKAEEKKPEESPKEKEAKGDGPAPGSPRWNEVYGKFKATERKLEEREKDFEAMREHNQKLEARLNAVEKGKADRPQEPEPDPAVDPDAYKKWHEMKRLTEKQEWDKQRALDRHETQVEMQKELHEDYLDMIKVAEREMVKDPELKKKIWGSQNPPKAAYQYGKTRAKEMEEKTEEETAREKAKKQTETESPGEGGAASEEEPEEKLTEAEARVVRNLFPDLKPQEAKEKYLKQKKAMGR